MSNDAPYTGFRDYVRPEWTDYSGHMNIAYYGYAFEEAARAFFGHLDISREYRERSNHSFFALETHTIFKRELLAEAPIRFEAQILAFTGKRIHVFYRMLHATENYAAATNETLYAHVDLAARRTVPVPPDLDRRLAPILERHLRLPRPEDAGRAIDPHRGKPGTA